MFISKFITRHKGPIAGAEGCPGLVPCGDTELVVPGDEVNLAKVFDPARVSNKFSVSGRGYSFSTLMVFRAQ